MNRINLCLHCGTQSVARDRVATVATPPRTRSWVPIAHAGLLDGVQSALERSGLHVVNEAHGLSRDGARYFGLLQLSNGQPDQDFGLVVGLRNSHDKSNAEVGVMPGWSEFSRLWQQFAMLETA